MGWVTAEALVYDAKRRPALALADDVQDPRDHRRARGVQRRDVRQQRQRAKRLPQQSGRRAAADAGHRRLGGREERPCVCVANRQLPSLTLPATGEEMLRCLTLATHRDIDHMATIAPRNGGNRSHRRFSCHAILLLSAPAPRSLPLSCPRRTDLSNDWPSCRKRRAVCLRDDGRGGRQHAAGRRQQDARHRRRARDRHRRRRHASSTRRSSMRKQMLAQPTAESAASRPRFVEWNLKRDVGMTCGGIGEAVLRNVQPQRLADRRVRRRPRRQRSRRAASADSIATSRASIRGPNGSTASRRAAAAKGSLRRPAAARRRVAERLRSSSA